MRAITVDRPDAQPALRDDLSEPEVGDDQILVRVHASSVNPVDNAIAAGTLAGMGLEHEYPVILGRDYAGVVERTGASVSGYRAGDHVFGFLPHGNPTVRDGAWAELIVVSDGQSIAHAPGTLELATAGAAALTGVSAETAVDALGLSEGDVVLVVGANGGVGSLAVQLAAHRKAIVVAPALPEDEAFLRSLGVAEVVPREADVVAAVQDLFPDGVDALLDCVHFEPGAYDAVLEPGARVVSPTGGAGDGPNRTNVVAEPTAANLERIARLLDSGALEVPIQATYGLDRAAEALQALATTHIQGKLAIKVM